MTDKYINWQASIVTVSDLKAKRCIKKVPKVKKKKFVFKAGIEPRMVTWCASCLSCYDAIPCLFLLTLDDTVF